MSLYWKTRNDPKQGSAPDLIRRLLHIPTGELESVLYSLTENQWIKTDVGFGDRIVISGKGIEVARSLIKQNKVSVIQFHSAFHIPPTDQLVFGFNYSYDLVSPDGSQTNGSIGVYVSDIAAMTLQLSFEKDQSGERLLLQYARDWLTTKIQEGSLQQREKRLIMTRDLESMPKYGPEVFVAVREAVFLVVPPAKPIAEAIAANHLAPLLIEERDAINALFYDQHGERVLLLPQERNILDFFKDATTSEEFGIRVMSLGAICREMNKDILRKLTGTADTEEGSVNLLKAYLLKRNAAVDPIIKPLKHLGRIRNGYPAHSDYANVVESYRYFGIQYPVENFQDSWQLLLNHYLKVLQELKQVLLKR